MRNKRPLPHLVIAMTLGAALTTACAGPQPKPKAAQSLGCSQNQINAEDLGSATYLVTGCGKKDVLYTDGPTWTSLREVAAFQLECDAGTLDVMPFGSDTYAITGCNKKATYLVVRGKFVIQTVADGNTAPSSAEPPKL